MNRTELYALLPDPDAWGWNTYRAFHNLFVDAINEWTDGSPDEDITLFATTLLEDIREMTQRLTDIITNGATSEAD